MTQHIHKYRRVNIGRDREYWVMQCQLSGCTHYSPMKSKLSAPNLKGKISICNKCGDPFEMDRRSIRMAEPTCSSCVVSPKEKELDAAARFFKNLEKGLG